jgi:small subunit ribosomal protein S8
LSVSDPIADYLTCIRNAIQAKKRQVDIPASNIKRALAEALHREKFIRGFKIVEDSKQNVIRIFLKYTPGKEEPVIRGIRRISTPGRRVYVGKTEIPRVLGGLGTAVLSTSKGVLTDKEAKQAGLGGEVICHVW